MALQIIQFHSLQMEIEKKASASEMCHSRQTEICWDFSD